MTKLKVIEYRIKIKQIKVKLKSTKLTPGEGKKKHKQTNNKQLKDMQKKK